MWRLNPPFTADPLASFRGGGGLLYNHFIVAPKYDARLSRKGGLEVVTVLPWVMRSKHFQPVFMAKVNFHCNCYCVFPLLLLPLNSYDMITRVCIAFCYKPHVTGNTWSDIFKSIAVMLFEPALTVLYRLWQEDERHEDVSSPFHS